MSSPSRVNPPRPFSPGAEFGTAAYDNYKIRIVSGTANQQLAEDVAKDLGIKLEPRQCKKFSDGEIGIQIENNIRGADVFVIQPTCPPNVNDAIMELLLLIHTLQLSSAKRITAVIPYYGYARQDRKMKPRVPISAAAVAHLLETMGPHRVVTLDLHCGQIQGFFRAIPVDNLYAENEFLEEIRILLGNDMKNVTIISPDAGGVARARRCADKLSSTMSDAEAAINVVTILKRRVQANKVESMQLVGDVKDQICFIVDDMIDTGGTICRAAKMLKERGAVRVYAIATHGVFSGSAMQNLNDSCLEEVWVTDSIPQQENQAACKKLRVISVASVLSAAIKRLHEEKSLSKLFEKAQSAKKASIDSSNF